MRVLPYARLTLHGDSPPEVVGAKLASMVAARGFRFRQPQEPFRGTIKGRHFKLLRVLGAFLGIRRHNSWQPVVVGDIVPSGTGTLVRVRMRLQVAVALFMLFWFGGLAYGAGRMARSGVTEGWGQHIRDGREVSGAGYGLSLIIAMMLVGYAMMSVSFWSEVKKAKALLCERLGCREEVLGNRLMRE